MYEVKLADGRIKEYGANIIPLLAIDPVRINKTIFDRNEHERIL